MPSNFLTPFLELEDEFCKSFCSMDLTQDAQNQRVVGFQRRHSLCPVTLPNSKFNSGEGGAWPGVAHGKLPASSLQHIPFRADRSVSMIEGAALAPPPGLGINPRALSTGAPTSTRYKTELCRTYEESGTCKYGAKCQFAHGLEELRGLSRHPKYKTEPCRTFHTIGFCPYGARCHFIHNADELENPQRSGRERPQLRQSVSFAGFSRSSSVSPPPSSPDLLSPASFKRSPFHPPAFLAIRGSGGFSGLQRSSSADSLSDPEDYTSSSSLSGSDSPGVDARRLPIFSRLSVSDD